MVKRFLWVFSILYLTAAYSVLAKPNCIKKKGVEGSTHVFTGTCVKTKTKRVFEHWQIVKKNLYVFECDSILKGRFHRKVKVVSGYSNITSSHDVGFKLGSRYVVYGYRKGKGKGVVRTDNCYVSARIGRDEDVIIKHDQAHF